MLAAVGKSKTFYSVSLFMDDFKMAGGINMLNHYKSIMVFFKKMISNRLTPPGSPPFEVFRSRQSRQSDGSATAPVQRQEASKAAKQSASSVNSWDKLRMTYHGQVNVKLKRINLDILTHTSPFSEDCLRLSMGLAYFKHVTEEITVCLENIALTRLEERANQKNADVLGLKDGQTAILQVPLFELVIKLRWNSLTNDHYIILKYLQQHQAKAEHSAQIDDDVLKGFRSRELSVEVKVNIPHKEDAYKSSIYPLSFEEGELGRLVQNSPIPIIHYQTDLFADLLSLPQLRHEYLMLNGIRLVSYKAIDQGASVATSTLHSQKPQKASKKASANRMPDLEDLTPGAAKDGSTTNKKVMETITKLFTHGEHAEEFTSYIDIIAFALDQQINVKGGQNILAWVSEVDFRLNASKMRLLMTNTNAEQVKVVPADLKRSQANQKNAQSSRRDRSRPRRSEKRETKAEKDLNKDQESYRICGVQAVINSVKFQTTFYKKEVISV
jgi:hypothetical protein